MSIRLAFMGFRHGHIRGAYRLAKELEGVSVVAACEEDAETRQALATEGDVEITHSSYEAMLDEAACDAVAVGDYYGRRGEIAIRALERGKHVISDKPICTRLEELGRIGTLSKEKGLCVGCQLDLRDDGRYQRVRELVQEGAIGEVQSVSIAGQHPLMIGVRPAWYFEKGKHGGTINDIGIHSFDLISWITGRDFAGIVAARSWNAFATEYPHFDDGGQFMLTLEGGCGVLGDVSYFAPSPLGYGLDQYWRLTLHGAGGVIETRLNAGNVTLARAGSDAVESVEPCPGTPGGYFAAFLNEVNGVGSALTTAHVLRASEIALKVQSAAFEGETNLAL